MLSTGSAVVVDAVVHESKEITVRQVVRCFLSRTRVILMHESGFTVLSKTHCLTYFCYYLLFIYIRAWVRHRHTGHYDCKSVNCSFCLFTTALNADNSCSVIFIIITFGFFHVCYWALGRTRIFFFEEGGER